MGAELRALKEKIEQVGMIKMIAVVLDGATAGREEAGAVCQHEPDGGLPCLVVI